MQGEPLGGNMNKKIAILILHTSVLALSFSPLLGDYQIKAVEDAKKELKAEMHKLDIINNGLMKRIKDLEAKEEHGLSGLSVNDQLKLKFLLHQVISYR